MTSASHRLGGPGGSLVPLTGQCSGQGTLQEQDIVSARRHHHLQDVPRAVSTRLPKTSCLSLRAVRRLKGPFFPLKKVPGPKKK